MKVFLDKPEFVEEIREHIEKTIKKLGGEKVADSLKSYGTQLENRLKKGSTTEIVNQINLELDDIDSYIHSVLEL